MCIIGAIIDLKQLVTMGVSMCLFSTLCCLHQPVCSAGSYQLTMLTSEWIWVLLYHGYHICISPSLSLSLSLSLFLALSLPCRFSLFNPFSPSAPSQEGQFFGIHLDLLYPVLPRSQLYPQCYWHSSTWSSVSN